MSNRIIESLDYDSHTSNFKYPFTKMTKLYGKEFIELLQAMWLANGEGQTEEEFCLMNGIDSKFFNKVVKAGK